MYRKKIPLYRFIRPTFLKKRVISEQMEYGGEK